MTDWVLDPEPAASGLPPLTGPIPSRWDSTVAGWTMDRLERDVWNQRWQYRAQMIDEMKSVMGYEPPEKAPLPAGVAPGRGAPPTNYARSERDVLAAWDAWAAENPGRLADLPSHSSQFEQSVQARVRRDYSDAAALSANAPEGRFGLETMGAIASGVADPVTIATAPFGAPARAGILATMAIEGGANALGEAMLLPQQAEMADYLGIEQPDPWLQVGTAGLIGAGLGGIVAGGARYLEYRRDKALANAARQREDMGAIERQAELDAAQKELDAGRRAAPPPSSAPRPGVASEAQETLDRLLEKVGPLNVISDYRTPEANAAAGGARGSQHLHGRAFDVDVKGMSIPERQALIREARAAGFSGIGVYENSLHFDVGGDRAWGPSYRRDSLPSWAGEAVGEPVGRHGANDFDAIASRIVGAESGGRADATNPNSSAAGAGQFLDATWLELVGRKRPELFQGRSSAEVLALRGDRALAREMVAAYARENADKLAAQGLPTDPASLYLAHFLGPEGAIRALRLDPAASVSGVMTPAQIAANAGVRYGGKTLAEFTIGDLHRWARMKMGGAVDPGASWAPAGAGYTSAGQVTTASGKYRIDVEYEVVDLASLRQATGDYQPRDRSRLNSDAWVAEEAARFDPARLMPAPTADRGAPIVGPDGMVESGNGRVRLIAKAYELHPDRAEVYRRSIADAGFEIPEGVERPVLVAKRQTELDDAALKEFVVEAQDSGVARMTPTEIAKATSRQLTARRLSAFDPGAGLTHVRNRGFLREVLGALPSSERNALFDEKGALNEDGRRLVRRALFARAWNAPDLISRFAEAEEDGALRALLGALDEAAPDWAVLRAAIEAGEVRPEFDITAEVLEAMRIIARARALAEQGPTRLADILREMLEDEASLFDGAVSPLTAALVRKFHPAGRAIPAPEIARFLKDYAREARVAGKAGDMLDAPSLAQVLRRVDPDAFADLPETFARSAAEPPASPQVAAEVRRGGFAEGAASPEAESADALAAEDLAQEVGPFGPVFTGYEGDPEGAIARLIAERAGEAVGVLAHPEVPDRIDIVWGDPGDGRPNTGYGLAKIALRHEEVLGDLQGRLSAAKVVSRSDNRIRLQSDRDDFAISRNWKGEPKTWLLTAYERRPNWKDKQGAERSMIRPGDRPEAASASALPDGQDTPSATADQDPDLGALSEGFDPDLPLPLPDGRMMRVADALDDIEQDKALSDAVAACAASIGKPAGEAS